MFWNLKPCIALDFILYTCTFATEFSVQSEFSAQSFLYEAFTIYPELSHCFDLKMCLSLQYLNFKVVNFVRAEVRNYISKFAFWLGNSQCNWLVCKLVPNFPQYCIAHPYCAQFLASLACTHIARAHNNMAVSLWDYACQRNKRSFSPKRTWWPIFFSA